MSISIVEILGTNKISASRPVINQNFFTIRDAVNSLLIKLDTVIATDTDLLKLYTAVSTITPLVRFQLDANTGRLTLYDDDGLTPKVILDKAGNGTVTLSTLAFSASYLGSLTMPFPGSTASFRNATVVETLTNGVTSSTDIIAAAKLYNGNRFLDGANSPIALSNVTSLYDLDLSTSYKNLIIISSLYVTGDGTLITVDLNTLTEAQVDGLEVSVYNSGVNPWVLDNVTYEDAGTKSLQVLPSGYAKIRRVSTGISATWVIVSAFNTAGV